MLGRLLLAGSTDSDGRLLLRDIPEGQVDIFVRHPTNWAIETSTTILLDVAAAVVPLEIELATDHPPTSDLTQPVPGMQVAEGSVIEFVAMADDDFGIERVDFLLNGLVVASDEDFPYRADVVLNVAPNSSVIGTAEAVDISENRGSSPLPELGQGAIEKGRC